MDLAPVDFVAGLGGLNALPNPAREQADALGLQQAQQGLRTTGLQQEALATALQQHQADQAHQQQFHDDIAALGENPTPAAISTIALKYPEYSKQIQDAHNIQDEAKRTSDFGQATQAYSAANIGRYDLAAQIMKAHRDASVKAGEPADPTDDAIITALESGDPKEQKNAVGMMGWHVRAIDPDKYEKVFGKPAEPYTLGEGQTRYDAQGNVIARGPAKVEHLKNADGSESIVQVGGESEGGGQTSSGGASGSGALSVRLNNPGAIRDNPANKWQGQIGSENGFAKFDTPANGERAHKLLIANQIKAGFDTPLTWAQHYAPASDGNDPAAYAATIAKGLGIGVNDKIPLAAVPKMAALSAQVERGGTPSAGTPPGAPGAKVLFTSKPGDPEGGLDQDSINFYAERVAAGDDLPALGSGKAATATRQAILKRAAQINRGEGIDGADSSLRRADVRAARQALVQLQKTRSNVAGFERTFMLNVEQVLKTAPKGVGGSSPVFNRWIQAGRKSINGDPDVSRFNVAVNTAANEYAKLASGASGGAVTSDSARHEAMEILNNAQTLPQLQAAIEQMKIDGHNRILALNEQELRLRGTISGKPQTETGAPAAPKAGSVVKGWKFKGGNPADRNNWVKASG